MPLEKLRAADAASLARLDRAVRRLALAIGALTAAAAALGFGFISYADQQDKLKLQARLSAERVAQYAYIQGDTWRYATQRVSEIARFVLPAEGQARLVVADALGRAVAEVGARPPKPVMRVSAPIVAGAKTVGTVAIETPLRPLIADIALLALLGAALGAGVYAGAHFLPMRALRRASGELGETQAALRQQVAKTDAALQEARIERGRAELANRAKSEFLANMSHELRTPLNAVIGFAELMKNRAAGPLSDEYADYAGDIQGSGQHLLAIVNDILDIAKLESGMMRLNPETVDLRELLTDCVGTVYMRAAAAGIRIAIDADPAHALHAVLDLTRVRQVLLNLLSNAVKFTPDAGRVAVSVREEAGWWVIAVADTGVGMNEEEVELAFLPFRQIDNSYARRFQGTGLGLPLARALAELHGGSLVLASAPGKGTTATLRLPRDPLGGAAGDGGKDGAGAETRGGRASLAA